MGLNSNALISVYEYTHFTGETTPLEASQLARYEQLINFVSSTIDNELGRTLMSGSLASEIFDGCGDYIEFVHDEYITAQAPIVATPSPALYYRSGGEWTACTTYWDYNVAEGTVYRTDGNYFSVGKKNWKVDYAYGYTSGSMAPQDIKLAACMMVKFIETSSDNIGKASETIGGQTSAYSKKWPSQAMDILYAYKRDV